MSEKSEPVGKVAENPAENREIAEQKLVTYEEYAPRQISLLVNRIDPWSVMKVSFLLSVAWGVATVLAAVFMWTLLNSMHVFASVSDLIKDMDASGDLAAILDFVRFPRVLALSTMTAIFNTVLITALATIGAMIYNLCASLVGGVKVSLMDD